MPLPFGQRRRCSAFFSSSGQASVSVQNVGRYGRKRPKTSVEVHSVDRYGRQSRTLSSSSLLLCTASCFAYLRAVRCQFPGTDCCLDVLRAAKCLFPGTDCRFAVLRAAKCEFTGTAADRLSWSAATARRCGGLCAMALLAAAVASRCSGYGHGHSGPNDTYAPSTLTPNRVLGAFQLSTWQGNVAEQPFPRPR